VNLLRNDVGVHKDTGSDDSPHDDHGGVEESKRAGELCDGQCYRLAEKT
jgi:hypothetical protein